MSQGSHLPAQRNVGWLALVLVLGLACGTYLNTLGNGFVLDDERWLSAAQQVDRGAPLASTFVQTDARGEDRVRVFRPLALLSLVFDLRTWRQNATGYHQTSVLLHTANALLVFWIAFLLTRRAGLAGVVAALFAVHPLATGCVSYVSNRGELLATTGVLISFAFFIMSKGWSLEGSIVAAMVSLAAFCVALGSAEIALVFPALAAFYLVAFDRGAKWRWMWVGLTTAAAVSYLLIRYRNEGTWGSPAAHQFPVAERFVLFFRAIGGSLVTLILPLQLRLEHSLTLGPASLLWLESAAGIAVIPTALFLLARARGGLPEVWFGTAWVAASILPSAVLASRTGKLTETWLYLPSVGFWLAGVALVLHLAGRRFVVSEHVKGLMTIALLVITGLMVRTVLRSSDWRDERKLLAQALTSAPNSSELRLRYGSALGQKGDGEAAIAEYRKAVQLNPNNGPAHTALAVALGDAGSLIEAVAHFREALRCDSNNSRMHFNLAVALAKQGDTGEAIAHYAAALNAHEPTTDAANNLAWLLATSRRAEFRNGAQAVEIASRVVQMTNAEDPELLDTLAAALAESGNFDEASRVDQQAAQLALSRGSLDQAAVIQSRLKLYVAGKPYRE
jgi:Flp pilus assembly protein TadD